MPVNTPFETVLVRAEPSRKKFIVYDPQQGRQLTTFKSKVQLLRPFLADYIDNFLSSSNFEEESENMAESLMGITDQISFVMSQYEPEKLSDGVAEWPIESGICTKVSADVLKKFGSGIFMVNYLDTITRNLAPTFPFNDNSRAEDRYLLLSLELLSGKLLN